MQRRLLAVAAASLLALVTTLVTVFATGSPAYAACTPAQLIANPGFETGTSPWTGTAGLIGSFPGQPPHSGIRNAWLDGDGVKHTDTLSQTVTLPAGCTIATLTYWLHIDTAETASVPRDKLTVKMGSTTVASYSNLDKNTGYLLRTIDVSSFAGQTVGLSYTGVESPNLQTSFVIDDVALDVADGASQDPIVTNPGNQTSVVGAAVSLQIVATDPQGDTLTYGATGLPAGLSISS